MISALGEGLLQSHKEGHQNYTDPIPWAIIERGFSVNKNIATSNMKEETIVAHRKVYVAVQQRQCSVP